MKQAATVERFVDDGRPELERWRGLELGLIRVRWFGVALGLYLLIETNAAVPPRPPPSAVALGWVIVCCLAAANGALVTLVPRVGSARLALRLGALAFLIDSLLVFGAVWAFSYSPDDRTWVVMFLLPLEAALRYGRRGALGALALTAVNELAREATFSSQLFRSGTFVNDIVFRLGIATIVAVVAGLMAESLSKEARRSAAVAHREAVARHEVAAFNKVILAGVAGVDLESSLSSMAAAIGQELQFDICAILLREGDDLVVIGSFGLPAEAKGTRVPVGIGVAGRVAASGRSTLISDVHRFPPNGLGRLGIKTEFATPLEAGGSVIGVLEVESAREIQDPNEILPLLSRLGDQIGLVVLNAQLRQRRERAEVELRRSYDSLRSMDDQRRRLLSHLVRVQEEERARIAGDIHDDPIQKMVAVGLRLEMVQESFADPQAVAAIEKLRESVRLAVGSLRDLSFQLRPSLLDEEGLAAALNQVAESLGDDVRVNIEDRQLVDPSAEMRVILFRIAQEALVNIWKHARARHVQILLDDREDGSHLRVADDGVGIASDAATSVPGHFGLASMRERAELAGGWCQIQGTPGIGTVVECWVPGAH